VSPGEPVSFAQTVEEACADALLAACTLALTLANVGVDEPAVLVLAVILEEVDRIVDIVVTRTIVEGPRPT